MWEIVQLLCALALMSVVAVMALAGAPRTRAELVRSEHPDEPVSPPVREPAPLRAA